jgi:serine/threonine protein kinase
MTQHITLTSERSKRFRDISVIGEGAYGQVMQAYDNSFQRRVAIKKFKVNTTTTFHNKRFSVSTLREISVSYY